MYDVYEIRKDFPILSELINGKPNTFLDTAASAQKPRQVIEKMNEVYFGQYATCTAFLLSVRAGDRGI